MAVRADGERDEEGGHLAEIDGVPVREEESEARALHGRTHTIAIRFPICVRAKNTSRQSSSRWPYCKSIVIRAVRFEFAERNYPRKLTHLPFSALIEMQAIAQIRTEPLVQSFRRPTA